LIGPWPGRAGRLTEKGKAMVRRIAAALKPAPVRMAA
jgi:hypothetical protein